jgi:deazaflavin-dependent oxidoreductase (nitroreductase family)
MARDDLAARLAALDRHRTLRLTTRGRKTGKRHTVTVWFLVDGKTLYLVTMNMKRDWPRNVRKNPAVELDIGGTKLKGTSELVRGRKMDEVRNLLCHKYWAAWIGSWIGLGPEGAFAVRLK